MNSMTDPTNSGDRINDSIVAAAITALAPFHPESAQQATDMLLFWTRRAEMTEADVLEVGERMFPANCPEWCTVDHREDDARDDVVLHLGDDHVDGTVRKLLDAHRLDIRVVSTTSTLLTEPGTAPTLNVTIDAELTTWEQAGELARTILDAFGYLKGA